LSRQKEKALNQKVPNARLEIHDVPATPKYAPKFEVQNFLMFPGLLGGWAMPE
jgi:hypothetical protein